MRSVWVEHGHINTCTAYKQYKCSTAPLVLPISSTSGADYEFSDFPQTPFEPVVSQEVTRVSCACDSSVSMMFQSKIKTNIN